jgi:hypothetical protein
MYFLFRFILCLILLTGFSSCSPRLIIVDAISDVSEIGAVAFEQDDDLDMLEKSIPGNIKLLEAILESNKDNYKILILLSRLYAAYSFGYFEGKNECYSIGEKTSSDSSGHKQIQERLNRYYSRGADYALRAIESRHPAAEQKLKIPELADLLLKSASKDDVPALFWYGYNLASIINNNRDSVKIISKGYLIEKIMNRITELDPGYFFGGAHLVLISYYSSLPPYSDKKLDLALSHYRRLKELSEESFLLADLYFSRYYLTRRQDKEKFITIMNYIANHSLESKKYAFYNKIASQRAKLYLERIDCFFEPE